MVDVVAMGELLIDFTPGGTNSKGMKMFTQNPGGAPANVLAMNARLGGETAFIGKATRLWIISDTRCISSYPGLL